MTAQGKMAEIKARRLKNVSHSIGPDHGDWLIARVEKLEKALKNQPQVVYETLLEATAWMGIPKLNREDFIKERLSNVRFIIDKALEE